MKSYFQYLICLVEAQNSLSVHRTLHFSVMPYVSYSVEHIAYLYSFQANIKILQLLFLILQLSIDHNMTYFYTTHRNALCLQVYALELQIARGQANLGVSIYLKFYCQQLWIGRSLEVPAWRKELFKEGRLVFVLLLLQFTSPTSA